jgi:Ser/Thr protein kinase RdoA (MazF antagonist)
MLGKILARYGISQEAKVKPFGNGLINSTWKISDDGSEYILQKINDEVFKHPGVIAENTEMLAGHLKKTHPEYFFVDPMKTTDGKSLAEIQGDGFYRLSPFVKNSVTHDIAETSGMAYEAAKQFGKFTSMLKTLPGEKLKIIIPGFHDLILRHLQFSQACVEGNKERIRESKEEIKWLMEQESIVGTYKEILHSSEFKSRVTHHDTKISNVLFNQDGKGICVIDLDTVMPGYFISDVGDMMRTYLSPVSEEEPDLSLIDVRLDFFESILDGYSGEMADAMTETEIRHFVYAGKFLIYMQALRFLKDHLNLDQYYGARYEGHTLNRAKNQIRLLQSIMERETEMDNLVGRKL